jgi:hypothetical protein
VPQKPTLGGQNMRDQTTRKYTNKLELNYDRRNLLEKMQDLNFGQILNIQICDGEPRFTSMTQIERSIRFGRDNHFRPEMSLNDFILKDSVVELFETLDQMDNGLILKLEIKGGLPFGMVVEEQFL